MRCLTAAEILSLWERFPGRSREPLRLALESLRASEPGCDWAGVPFGAFCRGLFELRALLFGPSMPSTAQCPQCGERLEFAFACDTAVSEPPVAPILPAGSFAMRLPTAGDLLLARSADQLLARCALEPVCSTPARLAEASERAAAADPLAETLLDMTCPACGHRWQALFDIVSYLAREIAHEAHRLLREVHALASAYGWPESDVLALSPIRRRAYLEMAGA